MSGGERPDAVESARDRVRAFVEAYRRTIGREIVTVAVAVDVPGGAYAVANLLAADLVLLLGADPEGARQDRLDLARIAETLGPGIYSTPQVLAAIERLKRDA